MTTPTDEKAVAEFFAAITKRMKLVDEQRRKSFLPFKAEQHKEYFEAIEGITANVLANYVVTGVLKDFTKVELKNPLDADTDALQKEGFAVSGVPLQKPAFRDVMADAIARGFDPDEETD